MYQPTDGPGLHGALNVTDAIAVEVKVGGSNAEERKVVSIQPIDGKIYYGYSSGVTSSNGTLISKKQLVYLETSVQLSIYIIANNGTVDVRITEVS